MGGFVAFEAMIIDWISEPFIVGTESVQVTISFRSQYFGLVRGFSQLKYRPKRPENFDRWCPGVKEAYPQVQFEKIDDDCPSTFTLQNDIWTQLMSGEHFKKDWND